MPRPPDAPAPASAAPDIAQDEPADTAVPAEPAVPAELADTAAPAGPPGPDEVGELIRRAAMIPFDAWQERGWHLTPVHYSSPIPDTRAVPDRLWHAESALPGIDMRDEHQLAFLHEIANRFGDEFAAIPRTQSEAADGEYFVDNAAFEAVDAELYYAMIRTHRPARVLEVGSGWSTLLALRALRANREEGGGGRLFCVEPYPPAFLPVAVEREPDVVELRDVPLQDLPLELFESLDAGDILFIDSSHVLRIGSDVQYEFLEILPRLPAGVLVHVHDVFLPGEYPTDWVLGPEHRFWNEQYLLQAYLAHNLRCEVVWGSSWMHRRHPEELEKAFPSYDRRSRFPGSFWFRCR